MRNLVIQRGSREEKTVHLRADGQGLPTHLEVSMVTCRCDTGQGEKTRAQKTLGLPALAAYKLPVEKSLDVSESHVKRGWVLPADLVHKSVILCSEFRDPRTQTRCQGRPRISHQFPEGLCSPLVPMAPQLTDLTSLTTQPRAVWGPQEEARGDRNRVTAGCPFPTQGARPLQVCWVEATRALRGATPKPSSISLHAHM